MSIGTCTLVDVQDIAAELRGCACFCVWLVVVVPAVTSAECTTVHDIVPLILPSADLIVGVAKAPFAMQLLA
jgi:hypothetical protein